MARVTRKTHLPQLPANIVDAEFAADKQKVNRSAPALYVETVFDQFLGMMGRIPDPDEVLKKVGIKRENLRWLESDDDITAALDTRREAVIGTPWRIEPSGTDQTDFIEAELRPIIEQTISCCMAAVPYGYSVGEIIYAKRDSGRIGVQSVMEKPFEWFAPKPDGSLVWFSQTAPDGELVDPIKFMLTVRQPTYRNPYGEALFSRLYWPWFFRQNGWKFWAKWIERFGQPFLVGKTKGSFTDMANTLQQAIQGAAMAIHTEDEIESLDATGSGEQFEKFEHTVVKRYHRSILGQTLTSDVDGKGSYAAASVHNDVREDKRNADLRMVSASVQRLVNNLWTLNGFGEEFPEFIMADDTGLELERAERDSKLVEAGVLKLTEAYLLDRYDFREGDFELPEAQIQPTDAPYGRAVPSQGPGDEVGPEGKSGPQDDAEDPWKLTMLLPYHRDAMRLAMVGAPPRFTAGQEAVERLAENTLSGLPPLIEQAAILRAIRLAQDPEDLADRLALLYEETDGAKFRQIFEQALFAAELMGYAHASDEDAMKKAEFAPTINVTAQFEPPPQQAIIVNVPEQPPPVVNVTVPEQAPPIVNVSMPDQPAPIVNVTADITPRRTETVIERDAEGNIVRATQQDIPDERTLN